MIKLTPKELKEILTPRDGKKLNVNICIIVVPDGFELAQVFVELGVHHVFTFNSLFKGIPNLTRSSDIYSKISTLFNTCCSIWIVNF
jgi:hypothetical protein